AASRGRAWIPAGPRHRRRAAGGPGGGRLGAPGVRREPARPFPESPGRAARQVVAEQPGPVAPRRAGGLGATKRLRARAFRTLEPRDVVQSFIQTYIRKHLG